MQTLYKTISQNKSLLYGWFEAMHTRIDLILCNLPEEKGNQLLETIQQKIENITQQVNRFDQTSELAHINQHAYNKEITLSPDLFTLLKYSIEAYHLTNGNFDITIQSPKAYTEGPKGISINPETQTIRFNHPDVQIDLCGIAKGHALDECKEFLLKEAVENFFLSFGNSSILGWGNHPNGTGWFVSGHENTNLPPIHLQNEHLTISGNETSDRKHLIQPTKKTYITGKKEIAVKTKSGKLGEILSTAYFVANEKSKKALKKTHNQTATFYP